MIPFIVGGAVALISAGTYIYKTITSTSVVVTPTPAAPMSLGRFAIWGRPNAGKSTFIGRLIGKPIPAGQKQATTTRTIHRNIPTYEVDGKKVRIDEIVDMPGTKDRLEDWRDLVRSHDHVFYIINLARLDELGYQADVRFDLRETVEALKKSSKLVKRLHIISSHVDESRWKSLSAAEVNNVLLNDDEFCKLYESKDGVAGYVYAANLTEASSFQRLIESIVKDSYA